MTAPVTPLERAAALAEKTAGPLKAVEKATAARQAALDAADTADAAWRAAITHAVEAGAPVADVAVKAGGLHRSRVWQIVTGKVAPRRRAAATSTGRS